MSESLKGDVVIEGAGPAGMFAAQHLIRNGVKTTVIEKTSRVGGAGLNVDGKFNFNDRIGYFDNFHLNAMLKADGNSSELTALGIIDDIKKTFQRYGDMDMYYNRKKLENLVALAFKEGIDFIPAEQGHIGSDKLPEVMNKFKVDLESRGVKFALNTEVRDLKITNGAVEEVITSNGNIKCSHVILCPGREGSDWFYKMGKRIGLNFHFNPLDIGIRVEVKNEVMEDIIEKYNCHDPKLIINTHTYDDKARTFCVCWKGRVTEDFYGYDEYHQRLVGANGHSLSRGKTPTENTNFALLVTQNLTEPQEDTGAYGLASAHLANILSRNKVILQRAKDLRMNRRSTWERIEKSYVKPTLRNVVPGDLGMALTYRVVVDLIDALEKLEKIIPGVYTGSTLFYGPEIKLYDRVPELKDYLQTAAIENLYTAGDGAGVSKGIVSAASTGEVAAIGIIKSLK